jgi:hypothetical protein
MRWKHEEVEEAVEQLEDVERLREEKEALEREMARLKEMGGAGEEATRVEELLQVERELQQASRQLQQQVQLQGAGGGGAVRTAAGWQSFTSRRLSFVVKIHNSAYTEPTQSAIMLMLLNLQDETLLKLCASHKELHVFRNGSWKRSELSVSGWRQG